MRRHEYPDKCEMQFSGVLHEVNLRAFRRGLVYRQIEGQYLGGYAELAAAARTSRSTVSRLLGGSRVSLRSLAAIAEALGLDVREVVVAIQARCEPTTCLAQAGGHCEGS